MVYAHNTHLGQLDAPFVGDYHLSPPAGVVNPFTPDGETLRRMLRQMPAMFRAYGE